MGIKPSEVEIPDTSFTGPCFKNLPPCKGTEEDKDSEISWDGYLQLPRKRGSVETPTMIAGIGKKEAKKRAAKLDNSRQYQLHANQIPTSVRDLRLEAPGVAGKANCQAHCDGAPACVGFVYVGWPADPSSGRCYFYSHVPALQNYAVADFFQKPGTAVISAPAPPEASRYRRHVRQIPTRRRDLRIEAVGLIGEPNCEAHCDGEPTCAGFTYVGWPANPSGGCWFYSDVGALKGYGGADFFQKPADTASAHAAVAEAGTPAVLWKARAEDNGDAAAEANAARSLGHLPAGVLQGIANGLTQATSNTADRAGSASGRRTPR